MTLILSVIVAVGMLAPVESLSAEPGNKVAWDAMPDATTYDVSWDGGKTWASVGPQTQIAVPTLPSTYAFAVRTCIQSTCSEPTTATITVSTTQLPPPPPPTDPPATEPPSAPQGLRVRGHGDTYVGLAWVDTSTVEARFVLERCVGAGCSEFAPVRDLPANADQFVDDGLTPGTVYTYRLKAVNAAGSSGYSNVTAQQTTAPAPPPGVIVVAPGGDVQAALDACQPGERVQLQAGARYQGAFTLPTKAAPGCTLTSSATLPARRMTPGDAALLPTVAAPSPAESALTLVNAANWLIDGVAVECTGDGDLVVLQDADRITFDRVLITCANGQKRGIRGNGTNVTLTRSHLAGIWKAGQDSQAFAAWDGAGPYTITDNYLEAASENVMFGGSNSGSLERIPSDILIEGNHFSKDLAWKGQLRNVKNLLELKSARRVTIRNNLFERGWADGQNGVGLLFSTLNDDGGSPWAIVSDVLVEKNIIRDIEGLAIGISGKSWMANQPTQQGTRYTIRDNDISVTGRAFHLSNNIGVAEIENNRVQNGDYALYVNGEPWAVDNLTFRHNTFTNPAMGWDGAECLSCTTFEQALPHFIQVYNGNWTTPPTPPPSPPVDPCVADPIVFAVSSWPSRNQKTQARFEVSSPRGDVTVTFAFKGNASVSATAKDALCSLTVTR